MAVRAMSMGMGIHACDGYAREWAYGYMSLWGWVHLGYLFICTGATSWDDMNPSWLYWQLNINDVYILSTQTNLLQYVSFMGSIPKSYPCSYTTPISRCLMKNWSEHIRLTCLSSYCYCWETNEIRRLYFIAKTHIQGNWGPGQESMAPL